MDSQDRMRMNISKGTGMASSRIRKCMITIVLVLLVSTLISPEMWGDEQVLCLCSMMWQIGLTVVSAENFTQIRFKHKSSLERADGVLVMCLGQHYVPGHKYLSLFIVIAPVYSHCARMRSDGYIMRSVGYIWQSDGCSTVPPS